MRLGELRHKVQIQRQREGDADAQGDNENKNIWDNIYADVPASIRQLSMRELELARQVVARASHRITIRFHPDIQSTDRILFGSRVFGIGSINNLDERNHWLEITASEGK
jgi:head-tail adaptor